MTEKRAMRKLTTILAADVVGYSRMMAADEEATLETLRAWREVGDALVEKHDGRVFSTAGDAFLAEFGSAVEAVRCAIAIQEELSARNAQLPEDRQMWFRIGVNVGDVMVEGGDLFGDGVNVAARLEGLAEPGGVCISGATFEHVKSKLSIGFDDIGAHRVKNIPEPVAAFRLAPGKVAVAPKPRAKPQIRAWIAVAAAAAAAAAVGVWHLAGRTGDNLHDGRWRVTVDGLSCCLDNEPRSFPLLVRGGRIDMQDQTLPKTGEVSPGGEVLIRVVDDGGDLRSTITATIEGGRGAGRFQGRKPGCDGAVTLVRAE